MRAYIHVRMHFIVRRKQWISKELNAAYQALMNMSPPIIDLSTLMRSMLTTASSFTVSFIKMKVIVSWFRLNVSFCLSDSINIEMNSPFHSLCEAYGNALTIESIDEF